MSKAMSLLASVIARARGALGEGVVARDARADFRWRDLRVPARNDNFWFSKSHEEER